MNDIEEIYFRNTTEWREWLLEYHDKAKGIQVIFYSVGHENESMRWEEAVQVALCFGWIDSTAKSLGGGKRRQYFSPRKTKSVWSALNKKYIEKLIEEELMHPSGLKSIEIAKANGSWTSLDAVENGIIPDDLMKAFNQNTLAFENYKNFSPSFRKGYLYWLNQAKKEETRQKRISEIIALCEKNIKSRF